LSDRLCATPSICARGYLEFHNEDNNIRLYAGRKELRYGSERVVGISDFINISRTWDGFFGHFGDRTDKNNIDVFRTSVVKVNPTSLDTHGAGLTFHGVYGTIGSWIPKTELQPFVLVRALPRVESQQGIYGSEVETTFGAETEGHLPAGFDYDILGDLQRGSYSNNSIHAGAGIVKVSRLFNSLPWKPRLGGEYDYATGNPHRNPNRIGTYDQCNSHAMALKSGTSVDFGRLQRGFRGQTGHRATGLSVRSP
jgi:hypothetical protein